MRSLFLLSIALVSVGGCGKDDSSDSPQTRTGRYTIGDKVRYQVERQGLGNPPRFVTEGRIVGIDGHLAKVEWSDYQDDGLSLIQWDKAENPEVKTLDYAAAPVAEPAGRSCDYQPETPQTVETAVGSFACVQFDYTCTKNGETIRSTGCESQAVAIEELVTFRKEYLDAQGQVAKFFTWTLLENAKN